MEPISSGAGGRPVAIPRGCDERPTIFAPKVALARRSARTPRLKERREGLRKQTFVPAVASIRSPRPRKNVGSHDSLHFWETAQYADVIRELAETRDGEMRILLAKTYVRLKDYRAAVACLSRGKFETSRLQQIAEIISASAAERLGDGAPFAPKLAPNASQAVLALRDFYAALSAWRRNDRAQAEDLAGRAAGTGDPETRVLATDLLGWIASSNGNPQLAARYFLSVLDQLKANGIRDEHVRINALQALAFVSVECLDVGKLRRLEKELEGVSANDATARAYLGALLSTAILYSLAGEDTEHYRTLLTARAVDVAKPFRALAETRLATFHRQHDEMKSARTYLSFAAEAMEGVDWADSDVEQRVTAVLFATEAAAQRDRRAGPAFTRAVSFRGKRDLALSFEHDRQATAQAYLARARLSEMRGELQSALDDFRRALSEWEKQGDRYRAALASLEVLRLEGTARISNSLRGAVRDVPKSWLSRETSRVAESAASPLAKLSPAERRVLDKICEGSTSRQIAEELGRSASTVRNQTISIFRKFGVSTRSALVAQVGARR
jgi:DNA-binding CsgD family transcriptional regulator